MDFAPLWREGAPVALHAFAAMGALALAPVQLLAPKGGARHRVIGWVWVALMGFVACGSFMIHGYRWIGPFGPIHLLSLLVLFQLWRAIRAARAREIGRHRRIMRDLAMIWLVVAGAFTLIPGRAMHAVIFSG